MYCKGLRVPYGVYEDLVLGPEQFEQGLGGALYNRLQQIQIRAYRNYEGIPSHPNLHPLAHPPDQPPTYRRAHTHTHTYTHTHAHTHTHA